MGSVLVCNMHRAIMIVCQSLFILGERGEALFKLLKFAAFI